MFGFAARVCVTLFHPSRRFLNMQLVTFKWLQKCNLKSEIGERFWGPKPKRKQLIWATEETAILLFISLSTSTSIATEIPAMHSVAKQLSLLYLGMLGDTRSINHSVCSPLSVWSVHNWICLTGYVLQHPIGRSLAGSVPPLFLSLQ